MKNTTKKVYTEKQALAAAAKIREWYYSDYMSVADCYGRFSVAKWNAEKSLLNIMQDLHGGFYRVTSFNTCTFSAAFIYLGIDKNTGAIEPFLRFETAYNTYIYNFYEVRECLPASDRAGFDLYYRAALQYLNGCAVREAV